MQVSVKQLSSDDIDKFTQLIRLFDRVFEMTDFKMPGEQYLQGLLNKDGFVVFAATSDDKVIGGLTAYTLPSYYAETSEMYLYDLAVDAAFQRQGIGKQLLAVLSAYCKTNNCREFFVQADAVDKHAIEFYRSTGGIAEEVLHFSYRQTDDQ